MLLEKPILVTISLLAPVLVYDLCAAYFLIKDREILAGCTVQRGAIWLTTLWDYCFVSAIFAPLSALLVARLPFQKAAEAVEFHMSRWRLDVAALKAKLRAQGQSSIRFGFSPLQPDWLLMAMGSVKVFVSIVLGVFAFWGYCVLHLLKVECRSSQAVFRELSLWRFGATTMYLQSTAAVLLLVLGMTFLISPLLLELTQPPGPTPSLSPEITPRPMLAHNGGRSDANGAMPAPEFGGTLPT